MYQTIVFQIYKKLMWLFGIYQIKYLNILLIIFEMNSEGSSLSHGQFSSALETLPLGNGAITLGSQSFSKGILNSLEVVNSRLTEEHIPQSAQSYQNKCQECVSCSLWEEWSIQAQKQMLILENHMIQKQLLLQSKMKKMMDQLQYQRKRLIEKQQAWQKQRYNLQEIIKGLKITIRQAHIQKKYTQVDIGYESGTKDASIAHSKLKDQDERGIQEIKRQLKLKDNHLFDEQLTPLEADQKNKKIDGKNYQSNDNSHEINLEIRNKKQYVSNERFKSEPSFDMSNNNNQYFRINNERVEKENEKKQNINASNRACESTLYIPSISKLTIQQHEKKNEQKRIQHCETLETIKAKSNKKINKLGAEFSGQSMHNFEKSRTQQQHFHKNYQVEQQGCFDFRRKQTSSYLPSLKFINKNNGKQFEQSSSNLNEKRKSCQKIQSFGQQTKIERNDKILNQDQFYPSLRNTENENSRQFTRKKERVEKQANKMCGNYEFNPEFNCINQVNSHLENVRQNRFYGGKQQEIMLLKNCGVSDKKSVYNKTATDCSYFKSRKSQSQIPQGKFEDLGNQSFTREKVIIEKQKQARQQKEQKQLIQRLLNLEFENQNLKSYNRVLLQKLSNSRPKKY